MKCVALIYNSPVQLLIYWQISTHTTVSYLFFLVPHIVSSPRPNSPPLPAVHHSHEHSSCPLPGRSSGLPVGLIITRLLFCRVVMCSVAHAHALSPSSPFLNPSLSSSHCSCSSHLSSCSLLPVVFYTPRPDSSVTQRAPGRRPVCAPSGVWLGLNLSVCLTSQRARL